MMSEWGQMRELKEEEEEEKKQQNSKYGAS